MEGLGKFVRHIAAVVVSAVFTWLLDFAPFIETIATPDQLATAESWAIGTLTALGTTLLVAGYAMIEKYLKRFAWLDAEGAADRVAIKEEAAERGLTT